MNAERAQQLYEQIGTAVVQRAPEGFEQVRVDARYAGKTSEYKVVALLADGSRVSVKGLPREFFKGFDELRAVTYQEGKGAWLSAAFVLSGQGRVSIDFDYDHEPAWTSPTVAGHYVEEVERYPRDPEHIPDWLRQRLAEAAQ